METADRIETQELIIRDKAGRARITMGMVKDQPTIQICDSEGTARIQMHLQSSYSDGRQCPEIQLLNDEGNWIASLGVDVSSETPKSANSNFYGGDMTYEEPHLYLCSRTGEELSGIDLLLHGHTPMLLFTHAGQPSKYSFSIDTDGQSKISDDPFV